MNDYINVEVGLRDHFTDDFDSYYIYKVKKSNFNGKEGGYALIQNQLPGLRLAKIISIDTEGVHDDEARPLAYFGCIDTSKYDEMRQRAETLKVLEEKLTKAVKEVDKYTKFETVAKMVPGMSDIFEEYKKLAFPTNNLIEGGNHE